MCCTLVPFSISACKTFPSRNPSAAASVTSRTAACLDVFTHHTRVCLLVARGCAHHKGLLRRVTATGPCVRNIKAPLPPLDRAGAASLYVVLAIGISLGVLGLIALCIAGILVYRWNKVCLSLARMQHCCNCRIVCASWVRQFAERAMNCCAVHCWHSHVPPEQGKLAPSK